MSFMSSKQTSQITSDPFERVVALERTRLTRPCVLPIAFVHAGHVTPPAPSAGCAREMHSLHTVHPGRVKTTYRVTFPQCQQCTSFGTEADQLTSVRLTACASAASEEAKPTNESAARAC